ncbi:MAG: hypothetical protein ACI9YH_000152 [Colwellia sp.]|jgi:hypothetical protein
MLTDFIGTVMTLKYPKIKENKKVETTEELKSSYLLWLLLSLYAVGVYILQNEVSSNWFSSAIDTAGPTLPVLIFLIAYMLVIYWHVFVSSTGDDAAKLADVFHAENLGDIASSLGLLGTIIAMVSAAGASKGLDVTAFLQSLLSTLIGISTYALSKFISTTFERECIRKTHNQAKENSNGH